MKKILFVLVAVLLLCSFAAAEDEDPLAEEKYVISEFLEEPFGIHVLFSEPFPEDAYA